MTRSDSDIQGIDGLASLLYKAKLDLGVEDVMDSLWLAAHMGEIPVRLADSPGTKASSPFPPSIQEEFVDGDDEDGDTEPEVPLVLPKGNSKKEEARKDPAQGMPFKAPAAPALRTRLELARSLRPLRRTVPSPVRTVFDEEATVARIADQGITSPVLTPAPERWLDLALVVEETRAEPIWRETIAEFQSLVEHQGAFRTVTTWRLVSSAGKQPHLFPSWKGSTQSQRPHSYKQLWDSEGRRLVLVLSDCTSGLWQAGTMHLWLEKLGRRSPFAVVQLLPNRLWTQTGLGLGLPVRLRASGPGEPTAKLKATSLMPFLSLFQSSGKGISKITIPVFTLEEDPLKQWAKMLGDAGNSRAVGVQFDAERLREEVKARNQESGVGGQESKFTAEDRVKHFQETASLIAQRLAGLMAAAPVSPPIVHLIRQTLLRKAKPTHVAEVFMGGLMDATASDDGERTQKKAKSAVHYDFAEGVRDLLLQTISMPQAEHVLDMISGYISRRIGLSTKSFEALLAYDYQSDPDKEQMILPFAQVTKQVLRRMGGDYGLIADRLETVPKVALPEAEPDPNDLFPLLQSYTFREATISFEVSENISAQMGPVQASGQVTVEQSEDSTDSYKSAIALIHNDQQGHFVGCGFLVRDRLLITAAHVVSTALGANRFDASTMIGERLHVEFLEDSGNRLSLRFSAEVIYGPTGAWEEATSADVAVLRLDDQPPEFAVQLAAARNYERRVCAMSGFNLQASATTPQMYEVTGDYSSIDSRGLLSIELQTQIQPGISGTPVWDAQLGKVVGMLVGSSRRQAANPTALAISAEALEGVLTAALRAASQPSTEPQLSESEAMERYGFTEREAEVWSLHQQKKEVKEIASQLHVTVNTIKKHLKTIGLKQRFVKTFGEGVYLQPFTSETASIRQRPKESEAFEGVMAELNAAIAANPEMLPLNYTQLAILQETWNGKTYHEMAIALGYSKNSVINEATTLWQNLSFLLGASVTKRSAKSVLLKWSGIEQDTDSEYVIYRSQRSLWQYSEPLRGGIDLHMVSIPSGTFTMGSPDSDEGRDDDEGPQHDVTISPFFMGKYPITQAQWRAVAVLPQIERELNTSPSRFKDKDDSDQRPVEQISWYQAVEFCARLSQATGREYRLPSEAEWEYACRANTTTPFHFGETITSDLANYDGEGRTYGDGPQGISRGETTPVGSFPANAFGLYDMHGNVREWCADRWHNDYTGAPPDGRAWTPSESGSYVLRGGSWLSNPGLCRSATRYGNSPDIRLSFIGLRVVCAASGP